ALRAFEQLDDRWNIASALDNLGYLALEMDDLAGAAARFHACHEIRRRQGGPQGLPELVEGFAAIAGGLGHADRAMQLLGAADAARAANETPRSRDVKGQLDRPVVGARAGLAESLAEAARTIGRTMTLEEAFVIAMEEGRAAELAPRRPRATTGCRS